MTAEADQSALNPAILIVDDQRSMCDLISGILELAGYQPMIATESDDAFRLVHERGHLDLLITDVVMPKMDGRRLAHWMRGAYPGTRVLFISGYSNKILAEHAAFLPKPFNGAELLEQVEALLAQPHSSHVPA